MDIVQEFYDNLAQQYDKLYPDWDAAAHEQAAILNRIFQVYGFDESSHIYSSDGAGAARLFSDMELEAGQLSSCAVHH